MNQELIKEIRFTRAYTFTFKNKPQHTADFLEDLSPQDYILGEDGSIRLLMKDNLSLWIPGQHISYIVFRPEIKPVAEVLVEVAKDIAKHKQSTRKLK